MKNNREMEFAGRKFINNYSKTNTDRATEVETDNKRVELVIHLIASS
jgi:hypothetical protein